MNDQEDVVHVSQIILDLKAQVQLLSDENELLQKKITELESKLYFNSQKEFVNGAI